MVPRQASSARRWLALPLGVVKLNDDASTTIDGWVGMGVVAWDDTGGVLFAATRGV